MMRTTFYKYQGTGNDFILIDNREGIFERNNTEKIAQLCHRRFGIGADGFILLENCETADFYMRYYNSDGNEASMCGNGGRCVVAFAKKLNIIEKQTTFLAPDGVHVAQITANGVALGMRDVSKIEQVGKDFFLDTGSPHYVRLIASHDNFDTVIEGRKIRYNSRFKSKGTNVNFISNSNDNNILSTYERGVENETFSCGTGSVASAIVLGLLDNKESHTFQTKGGVLTVLYTKNGEVFKNIILEGEAKLVFKGYL